MPRFFRLAHATPLFARWALALGYLSAVADRLGFWGPPGAPRVAWGAWEPFVAYTAQLNPYAPPTAVRFLAGAATFAEVFLGAALLLGWRLRATALASAALTATFALAMTLTLGVKAPLDYSVFAFVAASLLLATHPAVAMKAAPCVDDVAQPRATLVQLHMPVLDASLPGWRCLAPIGVVTLAACAALAFASSG